MTDCYVCVASDTTELCLLFVIDHIDYSMFVIDHIDYSMFVIDHIDYSMFVDLHAVCD